MFLVLSSVALVNFPVTVILARTLGPAEFGHFQFLNRIAFIAVSIAQIGLPHALSWAMTHARANSAEQRRIYRIAVGAPTCAGLLVAGMALLVLVFGRPPATTYEWILLAFYPVVNLVAAAVASAARGLLEIGTVALIRLSQALVWLGVVAAIAALGALSVASAVTVLLGSQMLSAIVAIVVVARHRADGGTSAPPDRQDVWGFARRVYFGHTARDLNVYLDQVIVGVVLRPTALGLYAFAAGLTLALNLVATPISATAQPIVQRSSLADRPAAAARLIATTVLGVGGAACGLAAVAPWLVPLLVGAQYVAAVPVVQILCGAVVVDGLVTCLHGILVGLGRPARSSLSVMAGLSVNVAGWAVLLVPYGIVGAAVTSVLSYSVAAFLMFRGVVRALPGTSTTAFVRLVVDEALGLASVRKLV
jgi:O-antigen/teichoic acid export membrane protein